MSIHDCKKKGSTHGFFFGKLQYDGAVTMHQLLFILLIICCWLGIYLLTGTLYSFFFIKL